MATLPQYKTMDVNTSNFDWSRRHRLTMAPYIATPIEVIPVLPGQKTKISLNSSIKTMQTLAPVLGSCAVQYEIYFNKLSNYVPEMADNDVGFDDNIRPLPAMCLAPRYMTKSDRYREDSQDGVINQDRFVVLGTNVDQDNYVYTQAANTSFDSNELLYVSPSSLWCHLGMGSGYPYYGEQKYLDEGQEDGSDDLPFSGFYFMTYLDIVRNYIANPQEDRIPCYGIGLNVGSDVTKRFISIDATPDSYVPLAALDDFFKIQREDYRLGQYDVWRSFQKALYPYYAEQEGDSIAERYDGFNLSQGTQTAEEIYNHFSGLFVTTNFPDMYMARLNSERVEDVITRARVSVTNAGAGGNNVGSFTIDNLRFGNKWSKMLNLSLFSGGRFDDWQRAQWSVKPNNTLRVPQFVGSFTQDIAFEEIVSTSGSQTGVSDNGEGLGAVAGRVDRYDNSANHYFESDTYGCIMIIATIIPRLGYSNNLDPHVVKTDLSDWFLPAFDRMGFQSIPQKFVSMLPDVKPTGDTSTTSYFGHDPSVYEVSVGSQPAWLEYMSRVDSVRGQFAIDTGILDYWAIQHDFRQYIMSEVGPSDPFPAFDTPLNALAQTYLDNRTLIGATRIVNKFNFTSYGNPAIVNHLFPEQSRTAENFYLQCYANVQVNIAKSKELLPNL